MLWPLSGPSSFTCWISFAPVFSFMYCWILIFALSSFLYLDLYVLGDDAWISKGSFMKTKHLCVSWSASELRVMLAHSETGLSPPIFFLLTVPRRSFFCGPFVNLCLVFGMLFASVHYCLVVTWKERADLLALVCDFYCDFFYFPIWYPGTDVVLDCIDSWYLQSFLLCLPKYLLVT